MKTLDKKKAKEIKERMVSFMIMLMFMIMALIGINAKSKQTQAQCCVKDSVEVAAISSVEQELTDIEQELKKIQESTKMLEVIGAYSIVNQTRVKPTKKNVTDFVALCEFWYPDIVLAQYQIESGSGQSKIAKTNNNLFGMRKAFTRKSVRCRTFDTEGYAVYNTWQLSVIDRMLWDEFMFKSKKPSRRAYLDKIKSIYSEDETYMSKLEQIAKTYK